MRKKSQELLIAAGHHQWGAPSLRRNSERLGSHSAPLEPPPESRDRSLRVHHRVGTPVNVKDKFAVAGEDSIYSGATLSLAGATLSLGGGNRALCCGAFSY